MKKRYIVGASFNSDTNITGWFNGDPYHSPPLALSLLLNTIYKESLAKSVSFINHPLPLSLKTEVSSSLKYQRKVKDQHFLG